MASGQPDWPSPTIRSAARREAHLRRLLRDIADGKELGDVSTLRDPGVVEELQAQVSGPG